MKQLVMLAVAAVVVSLAGLSAPGSLVQAQTSGNFTVDINPGTSTLNENAGQTEITVHLTLSTSLDTDTTVSIQNRHGAATAADYAFTGDSVTIAAGQTSGSGTVHVTPLSDDIVEGTETFELVAIIEGAEKGAADMSIQDDDEAWLSITGPSAAVDEGSNAVFTVTLSHSVAADVTVALTAKSGSGTAGSDFDAAPLTVTFSADSEADATRTASVPVTDDKQTEDAEDFSVSLGAITGDLASQVSLKSGESSASATIGLNDLITINVSGSASVTEGETASYTISLSPEGVIPPTGANLVVEYLSMPGTAIKLGDKNRNVADFERITGIHTFTADSPGRIEVSVATFDDGRVEEDETFRFDINESFFSMGPNDDRLRPGFGTRSITTTILNDDVSASGIFLSVNPPSMEENDGPITFTVTATLSGGSSATADIPVAIALSGTATEGSDYTVTTALSSITIPANSGSGSGTLTLTPIDDTNLEFTEIITLSGSAGELSVESADITLVAQISERAYLSISGPAEEVTEGSDAKFTATLSDPVVSEVTVAWSADRMAGVDDAEFSDYGNGDGKGSFTIPANTLTHTFAVPVNDDELAEPAEVIYINIGVISAPGFFSDAIQVAKSEGAGSAHATIAASDPITVSLSGPVAPVYEENGASAVATYMTDANNGSVSWTVEGTDAATFSISGSGELRFRQSPDFESPADADGDNRYEVTIRASDGSNSATLDVTVTVTNVNDDVANEPGRPTDLSAKVDNSGTAIALTWKAPSGGSTPSGYHTNPE